MMTAKEKQATKERKQEEKQADWETKQSARYQVITKTLLANEKIIEMTSKAKEILRAQKSAIKENEQSARYEAIKKADLAREQAHQNGLATLKLKVKKQP
jgi:hypothetical protein